MIRYRIRVADTASHHFDVEVRIANPAAHITVGLPVWIPGSYLVREFARHLSGLTAHQAGKPCAVAQLDKAHWRISAPGKGDLVLTYRIYAFDASVRTAYLDDVRGFFNPTSVFVYVQGREDEAHAVEVAKLPKGWRIATAMTQAGKRHYEAASYDELADHPFELGEFWQRSFQAGGVTFDFVVAGQWPSFDGDRLMADAQKICAAQIAFWHEGRKPPFSRYVFMLYATEDGYGGLEHRASTALIAPRKDLPARGMREASDGYVSLLGLISHEFFHTWNVKRLKPAGFMHYDYTQENYTELLWFFEGFTSYYDDLMLLRAGLIDAPRYLKLVSRTIAGVNASPGQRTQSVAEASFDAWVKYYRQDENTVNATISYYTKGSLVALLLDVRLRAAGAGSLDDVMRALWSSCPGGAMSERDVLERVQAAAGAALAKALAGWVHGREALPLAEALAQLGVQMRQEVGTWAAALGLKLNESPLTGCKVASVANGSAAHASGLSAGDELLAVDGWRIRKLDDIRSVVGDSSAMELLICRQQRMLSLTLKPQAGTHGAAAAVALVLDDKPNAKAAQARVGWLGV